MAASDHRKGKLKSIAAGYVSRGEWRIRPTPSAALSFVYRLFRYRQVNGWTAHVELSVAEKEDCYQWILNHEEEIVGIRSGIPLELYSGRGIPMGVGDRERADLYLDDIGQLTVIWMKRMPRNSSGSSSTMARLCQ
jgi:hypothetical protein